MQDDITDGVEWLKKEGIADPKRIAIYGGSYGGMQPLPVLPLLLICMPVQLIMLVFPIYSPL